MNEDESLRPDVFHKLCMPTTLKFDNKSREELNQVKFIDSKQSILKMYSSCNSDFYTSTLTSISNDNNCDQACDVDSFDFQNDSNFVVNVNHSKVVEFESEFSSDGKSKTVSKKVSVCCLSSYEELIKRSNTLCLKFRDSCRHGDHTETASSRIKRKKTIAVKCLENIEDLMKKTEELGLKFVDCSEDKEIHEVDLILEDKMEEGQKYYLVKWKNCNLKTNTWEPDYHLTGCQEMILYYDTLRSSSDSFSRRQFLFFLRDLTSRKPCDNLTMIKVLSLLKNTSEYHWFGLTPYQLKSKVRQLLNTQWFQARKFNKQLFEIMRYAEERKRILISLKEWEIEINSFNPAAYIKVENNVDLELPPADFQFVHDYLSTGIPISEEPVVFCHCDDCYEDNNSCCPLNSEAHFAYNKFKRLQLLPGYPIYECNKLCRCSEDCINRVVQHGQKIKVAIFRTSTGKDWGLKTLETIQKDQFVCEYVGEILTSDDAEKRGKVYDYIGRSYLFDLDYGEENCKYTVDAGYVGNSSHFINHSCNPNLHVFAVWVNNQDPNLPRLAFFAKRKINHGEELTFDYKMVKSQGKVDNHAPVPETNRFPCKCNSRNCRKYLF